MEMTRANMVRTIMALRQLPETEETREHRNALEKLICDKIRNTTNNSRLMALLFDLLRSV